MALNAVTASLPRTGTALPPAGADAAASGSGAFAALLDREQAAPPDSDDGAPCAETPARGEPTAAQRAARATKAPARPSERTTPRAAEAPRAERPAPAAESTRGADTTEPADDEAATPADPALMHWLQGLNLPPAQVPAEAGAALARGARPGPGAPCGDEAGDAAAAMKPSLRGLGAGRHASPGPLQDDPLAGGRAVAAEATAMPAEAAAVVPAGASDGAATPRFQDTLAALRSGPVDPSGAPAATGPSAAATPGSAAAEAAPMAAAVPVPLDDPQFPRAFGVQVSVLARDGVQKAELHLNPSEMGPVSVQIVMDGTQARIDFGADAAPTRALIEHSLPELAAALREAGLTLAGGGVSQHAGQGRDTSGPAPGSGPAGRADTGTEAAAIEARPLRRAVSAGGVDLYA